MIQKERQSNECLAISLFSISQVLFPISYIYISEHNFSMAESNIFRGIILFIICVVTARMKDVDLQKSIRRNFSKFFVRNMAVLFHMYSIFLCHYYLSISIIHTINTLGTIFVFMWDYYLYGITINMKQFIGIVCGVVGMVLTVNSTKIYLLYDPDFEIGSSFENYHAQSIQESIFFALLFLVAVVIWSYSVSLVKTVKMKDSAQMNYHLSILVIISAGIHYCLVQIEPKGWQVYMGSILFTSIPIGLAQVLFVNSLTLSKNTGVVSLFLSVSIIVGYCLSLIRYDENWNPIAVIGSLLIIAGLTIVVLWKEKTNIQIIAK